MKKILIVEDDEKIAMALTLRLKKLYRVACAYDATTGVRMALKEAPDLVLLDISLPGGGGLLVAESVRATPASAQLPIVFLTASRDPELMQKALAFGPSAFFGKPYNAEELLDTVERTLNGKLKAPAVVPPPEAEVVNTATAAAPASGTWLSRWMHTFGINRAPAASPSPDHVPVGASGGSNASPGLPGA